MEPWMNIPALEAYQNEFKIWLSVYSVTLKNGHLTSLSHLKMGITISLLHGITLRVK